MTIAARPASLLHGSLAATRGWVRAWAGAAMFVLALLLPLATQAQQGGESFDHMTTGFLLRGAHEQVRCETCHIKGIFKGTPKDCASCHVDGNQRGALAKPFNHIQTAAACDTCHTTSSFGAVLFSHVSVTPGSCATCHDGRRAQGKGPTHFPTTLSCDQCHKTGSFIPALNFDHSSLNGVLTTCSTCHDGRRAKGPPGNHIPTPIKSQCATCHLVSTLTGFTSFAGGMMDHGGVTSGCAACHGPNVTASSFAGITSIVVMPPTTPAGPGAHIPSGTTCESCHVGALPAGLIPPNATVTAPGTRFATPVPTTTQIHGGVTGNCSSCHETNAAWMGMSAYPIAPSALTPGAQYTGFQTRPQAAGGQFAVADAAHPTGGDCSQCHSGFAYFSATAKPANHIPTAAAATCNACHTSTDFSVLPTLTNIHANAPAVNGNCAQCHGAAAPSFAIPAANFSIVGLPSNHLPTTASCEACHVGPGSSIAATPVVDGARFSGSLMSHAGITSNCADCHGPGITGASFAGVARIVAMPPTSPAGAGSHIPSSTACETCHLGTVPAAPVAAAATRSAPGTLFASPAPTTTQIHAGVTGGCSSCHDSGNVWMGVANYPIAPTVLTPGAQYTGFQTRPRSAGGTYNIADPAHPPSGDCSQCHSSTSYFSAQDKPANHIPTSGTATCNACHATTDFAAMPSLANIHANAPSTSSNCAQCHGAAAPSFAIPAANFSIVGLPSNHLPTTASCETCHVGPGSSIAATPVGDGARFSGSLMSHTGITNNCAACHGPGITGASFTGVAQIVAMPATSPVGASAHIPSSTTCETCHLATTPPGPIAAAATRTAPGTLFASPAPSTTQIHTGITGGCSSCHDTNFVWMGVGAYPIAPTVLTSGAQYTGFQTRPKPVASTYAVADAGHPAGGDCSQCHGNTNYFTALDKPANHIPTASNALCTACHTASDFAVLPTLANIHANAPSTSGNCAQCHGAAAPSFAIPAANFSIVGLPSAHIPTTASCETCHVGPGSSIAATPVGNGAKFSGSLMSHSGIASNCAACHGPGITGASFTGVAKIIAMPPTSPPGTAAHIPSSTTCETCHLGATPAGAIPAAATATAPGTLFATPAPTTTQIHSGVTGGCSSCHDTSFVWMGVSAYPIAPTVLTPGAQYTGFHTRPKAAGGTYNVADPAHPATGDCSQCHSGTSFFSMQDKPANHIPTSATATCNACHTSTDFSVLPTLANIHANAPSTSANCAQCHGAAAASFAIPAANFSIVGLPSNHIPTSAACESCHVGTGSSIAATPVGNGARFSGSRMSHAGITSNCADCHGPGITGASFVGVSKIVVMPGTSPVGASSHIPSSTTCETCHLATTPAGSVPAVATKTAPGTLFATPAPTTTQIHTGVTGGCSSCHDTSFVWMGVSAYPIAPTVLTPGAQYTGFHTRPKAAGGTYNVADPAHPTTGDCSQCHASTSYFSMQDKPANHIPTSAAATCNACHTSTDFSVLPTLANIHANAPSTSANCAQCHGAAAPSFAIPAANFSIVGLPSNHLPTTASCESCHVGAGSSIAATPVGNGARFSGSRMSHAGITNNCAACHGPGITGTSFVGVPQIVVMPATSPVGTASHIPSSTTCETCHLATTPGGSIAAAATKTAPGTLFATPAPTTAQIHTGITGGCSSCHDTNFVWMGMSAYPIAPSVLTTGAQYTGFHARPATAAGTFTIADAAHPTTGDCSQCHGNTSYFTGQDKPANHIPTASAAQCSACHTSADLSVMPTLANIHANAPSTSANCAQCHGAAAASFAIPAANFSIVGLPSNHLPTTASCESCHVGNGSSIAATPVGNGAKFSGSLMSHAGITSNCVACHGPSVTGSTFAGVPQIVAMPAVTPMGASSHIPSSTTCETCHLGTTPAAPVAAAATKTAPGTLFATPAPTTTQIHTGITGGCSSCHDTSFVWMGVSAYPIAPTVLTTGAQYTGFQTRPQATAGTYRVADAAHPSTGDCSQCHSGVTAFTGVAKPANHIPTAAAATCNACHTSTDYSVLPTLTNIHANAPSTSANCAQCHGSAAASFAIPAANFSIVGLPSNHIPTSAACESCHVGTGSSVAATPVVNGAKFSGSLMSHAGITSNCVACHGPTITGTSFAGISKIVAMPAVTPVGASSHIPSSTTCETCHLGTTPSAPVPAVATKTAPGTLFATPAPTTTQIHTGISSGCSSCHDTSFVWMGVSAYPIAPTVLTSGAQYTGFQTRPQTTAGTYRVADAAHPTAGDCSQCHTGTTYFSAVVKPANHIPTSATATCNACHTSTDYSVLPTLTNIHANAPSTSANCAQCHGSAAASFAIPAANFSIVGLPSNHVPTTAACESCHVGTGSSIAATPVVNGAKFSGSRMSHAGITSNCVACHGPTITGTSFAGISKIVVMPATSPAGATSHIPSSTTCETCHLGTTPSASVPAVATKTAPGTLFATPAPTTTQIHTGVSSGCSSCHDTSFVWMGMTAYPIAPTVLTTGAQYTGFQTRPQATAGTYRVADAAHPTAGDCSQCHSGTAYFSAVDKPANHIPTASAAQCSACHTSTDYSVLPTLTNIHANAPSTSTNCAQCHGTAAASFAIPAANFSIVGLPSNHIPTSAACESCHVGAGSSIAATPVVNGAKFSGSRMSHTGITSNCVACHGPSITGASFAGISKIVVMPATSPVGASSHIPSSTTCETCHLGTTPAGSIAAVATKTAPGTLFATPAPTTTQIHTGITGGCSSCHDTNFVWMGVSAYPIAPTVLTSGAQYTGFQTRPQTGGGTYFVADAAHPTTGDCSQCHTGTTYFSGLAKPTGHIPTTLACATCHIVSGDFSVAGLASNAVLHTGITSSCITCHGPAGGGGSGPFAGCATQAACSSPPPVTYQPKVPPLASGALPTTPSKSTHIPVVGIECSLCHSKTVFTGFNTVPGATGMKGSTPDHTAVSAATCESCHEYTYQWYGVTIKTPGSTSHHGRTTGEDCVHSGCHNRSYSQFSNFAHVRPILRSALAGGTPRLLPDGLGQAAGGGAQAFDHVGVLAGQCQSCHNGDLATGRPARHIATRLACDSCHRTTSWTPAQYGHQGVLKGQCQTCHDGLQGPGKPSGHFVSARSCDACHRTIAWVPVNYSHVSPLFKFTPDKTSCVSCHVTNGELIPRMLRGRPGPKPIPPN